MASVDISATHHVTLNGHLSDVTWVDFSFNILASCSSDKTVRLWDMSNPQDEIKELNYSPLLGHRYTVNCCCFSPFGKVLATCSRDGYVILWDPKNGNMIDSLRHPSETSIRVCKFSPNSSYLATGSEDDTLAIWDVLTRTILRTIRGHEASVTACSFTPDNNFIISGSTNGDLRLWDVRRGDSMHLAYESEGHDLGVMGCEFSPSVSQINANSGNKQYLLATCGNDDVVRLFNVTVGKNNKIVLASGLSGHQASVMCCRFSPNGKLLASASGDKTVIVWNVETRTILLKLLGHERYVTSCAFSPCNNYIASGSNDKTVIVWKINSAENLLDLLVPSTSYNHLTTVDNQICTSSVFITKADSHVPSEFFCPITHEVMQDPVILSDGFSYERSAITKWLHNGNASSPMTNAALTHTNLTPNYALRMLINRHLEN